MSLAISVEHVSKSYHLGTLGSGTLREDLALWWARRRRTRATAPAEGEPRTSGEFRALDDVSFQVHSGDVLGIIGRNGAGKSTLLKILSRVTAPTSGEIKVWGRVASLLEVGTGFHTELSGRENIFLNGSILGMTKAEIRKNFDEIVAFSECEQFLDTPVKRYSSGMYVRLAFAVAAHLTSEILVVDEVLAVGDITFQKKCLGKMRDVSRLGRTVLFVSHSMSAVAALCTRGLLLESGRVLIDGDVPRVVAAYQADRRATRSDNDLKDLPREGSGKLRFVTVDVHGADSEGQPLEIAATGCNLVVTVRLQCHAPVQAANVAVIICDSTGYRLIDANTALKGEFLALAAGECATVRFDLEDVLLRPGTYFVNLWTGRGGIEQMDNIEGAAVFVVHENASEQRHTEIFPGPYQCRFTTSLQLDTPPRVVEIAK